MPLTELLGRQWLDYRRTHRLRRTLLVHLITVPAFVAGNMALIATLLLGMWLAAVVSLAVMGASLAWQGRCHRDEPLRSKPFSGPAEAATRILLEQWVTFPRFVLFGSFMRALRKASHPSRFKTPAG